MCQSYSAYTTLLCSRAAFWGLKQGTSRCQDACANLGLKDRAKGSRHKCAMLQIKQIKCGVVQSMNLSTLWV